jgi:hypothetical protein
MEIGFPENATYDASLGRLRKALKPHIADLQIRKRPAGVLISGAPEKVTLAMLILPSDYAVRKVSGPESSR